MTIRDKRAIRAELEATRTAYHQLLADIPVAAWERPSHNPAWNVRQILAHIIMAVEYLPQDIKVLRQQRRLNIPPWLFNWLNIPYTRWYGRNATPASLAAKYNKAHHKIIALLDDLSPKELALTGDYPDINANLPGGKQSIADMFHYVTVHFNEHKKEIEQYRDTTASAVIPMNGEVLMSDDTTRAASPIFTYPDTAWRQAMFKWPIQLWRLGLGPIMGQVMMVITHTGRKSGQPRRTMVEHYWQNGRPYVIAAWGEKAQWVKNLQADPHCTIQTARGTESAIAVRVDNDAELWNAYHLFMEKDPFLTQQYLAERGIAADPNEFVAQKDRVYLFRFDATAEPTPPPLDADLGWVLPATAVALLGLWLLNKRRQ